SPALIEVIVPGAEFTGATVHALHSIIQYLARVVQSAETHPTDDDLGGATGPYLAEFRRPLRLAGIAAVGLAASYVVAVQRPVP
ncbi:hypothetical protein, partial [Streptococcus pneumoniae]|uniref:hypothetical protein n=1 Tax=Streptococcus pneumoniae TaxID=1313 RepID=UPI0018B081BE